MQYSLSGNRCEVLKCSLSWRQSHRLQVRDLHHLWKRYLSLTAVVVAALLCVAFWGLFFGHRSIDYIVFCLLLWNNKVFGGRHPVTAGRILHWNAHTDEGTDHEKIGKGLELSETR